MGTLIRPKYTVGQQYIMAVNKVLGTDTVFDEQVLSAAMVDRNVYFGYTCIYIYSFI